ncbi:scoloptoxin SSD14-like isoform X1 [Dermacentor albipictus]|uniref:scoloptoxin SSD14-like isoform X1 n=1 Tax=Dermacentor albipictus TaxID=60249 RepID=UPI0038FBE8D0
MAIQAVRNPNSLKLAQDVRPPSVTSRKRKMRMPELPLFTETSVTSRRLADVRGQGSSVVAFAAVFLLLTTATVLYLRIPPQQRSLRGKRPISNAPLGSFSSWAAIVGHERCNHVPRKILIEMNGTAADAAVASMLCVCVVLSHACGLGGGFYALHYKNKTPSEVKFVDAWETAPLQASEAHYVAYHNDTIFGVRSAGVPGQVSGFRELLDAGGSRLPWAALFEEAIKVASQGAPVTTEMARQLARRRAHVLANPALRSLYTKNGLDTLVGPEDVVVNEPLARTLQILAAKGSGDFYTGSVAADLLRDVRASDGLLTEKDLAEYRARVGNATGMQLDKVMTMWSAPPPSSGIVVSFILALMSRFRLSEGMTLPDDGATAHRLVEAFKYAIARRGRLEDPLFGDVTAEMEELQNAAEITRIAANVGDKPREHVEDYGWRAPAAQDHGSSFVAVVAPDGDAVVLVASLNWDFGSLWLSPSTGVLLNNRLDAFSYPGRTGFQGYPEQLTNRIAPRKRPMSSAAPLLFTSDGLLRGLGAPTGGPLAITGAAQVAMRALWMKHTIKEAIDCGRLHHPLLPDSVRAEEYVDADIQENLQQRGHRLRLMRWQGTVHVIFKLRQRHMLTAYDTREGTPGFDGD